MVAKGPKIMRGHNGVLFYLSKTNYDNIFSQIP
jgi:hypothetical protein